jgi:ribosomal protein L7/L12
MSKQILSLSAKARQMRAMGRDDEAILSFLREGGCSILESIKIIRELKGGSLAEAKRVVHLSQTWADARQAYDQLHDSLETAAMAPDASHDVARPAS